MSEWTKQKSEKKNRIFHSKGKNIRMQLKENRGRNSHRNWPTYIVRMLHIMMLNIYRFLIVSGSILLT